MNKGVRPRLCFSLLAVLLVAFGLRVHGIGFGRDLDAPLDFSYHIDEQRMLVRAVEMTRDLDLDPHWFHYPSLLLYANFTVLLGASLLGSFDPYILARGLTAVFGTLTVAVVFGLGRRLRDARAGLLAALLLGVSFLHVRSSHFVTTDVPMTLFSTLAGLLTLRFLAEKRQRDLWLSFLAAGLAAGTKYNGGLAIVMPILALLSCGRSPWTKRAALCLAGCLLCVGSFLLTTPYALVRPAEFVTWLIGQHRYQMAGHFGFERSGWLENFLYLSSYLFWKGLGPIAGSFAVLGAAMILGRSDRRRAFPLVAFSAGYLVWLASYRTSFTRNMMPIVPFMASFAALACDAFLARWVDRWRTGAGVIPALGKIALVAAIVIWPARDCLLYNRAIARSSRTAAIPWILENLPAGSRIVTELYGPPLHVTHPGRYDLIRVRNLGTHYISADWFEKNGVDFIISNSGSYEMVFSNPGRYPSAERLYRSIDARYRLIKLFEGDRVDPLYSSISPTIRIYDCRSRSPE